MFYIVEKAGNLVIGFLIFCYKNIENAIDYFKLRQDNSGEGLYNKKGD